MVANSDPKDTPASRPRRPLCAHCGFPIRGFARIGDSYVCHTDPPFPDCYRLVTIYGEELGFRRPGGAA